MRGKMGKMFKRVSKGVTTAKSVYDYIDFFKYREDESILNKASLAIAISFMLHFKVKTWADFKVKNDIIHKHYNGDYKNNRNIINDISRDKLRLCIYTTVLTSGEYPIEVNRKYFNAAGYDIKDEYVKYINFMNKYLSITFGGSSPLMHILRNTICPLENMYKSIFSSVNFVKTKAIYYNQQRDLDYRYLLQALYNITRNYISNIKIDNNNEDDIKIRTNTIKKLWEFIPLKDSADFKDFTEVAYNESMKFFKLDDKTIQNIYQHKYNSIYGKYSVTANNDLYASHLSSTLKLIYYSKTYISRSLIEEKIIVNCNIKTFQSMYLSKIITEVDYHNICTANTTKYKSKSSHHIQSLLTKKKETVSKNASSSITNTVKLNKSIINTSNSNNNIQDIQYYMICSDYIDISNIIYNVNYKVRIIDKNTYIARELNAPIISIVKVHEESQSGNIIINENNIIISDETKKAIIQSYSNYKSDGRMMLDIDGIVKFIQ